MIRASLSSLLLVATSALAAGCEVSEGEPPTFAPLRVTDVDPAVTQLTGLTVDSRFGTLVLAAPDVGLIEVTPGGNHLRTMRVGDWGLDVRHFEDVAILEGDRFLLATDTGVKRYDAFEASLEELPCKEEPLLPLEVRNRALAVDPERRELLVAPALYPFTDEESPEPVETVHLRCVLDDGTPLDRRDVRESGVIAEGIAFDPEAGRIYAVSGRELHMFDGESRWLGSITLDGIEDATGVALDHLLNTLYVSDGTRLEVHAFDLEMLRSVRFRSSP